MNKIIKVLGLITGLSIIIMSCFEAIEVSDIEWAVGILLIFGYYYSSKD